MEGQRQNHTFIDMPSTPVEETYASSPPPYDPIQPTLPRYTSSSHPCEADTATLVLMTDEKVQHKSSGPYPASDSPDYSPPSYQALQLENNILRKQNAGSRRCQRDLFLLLIATIVLLTCFILMNARVLRKRNVLEMELLQEILVFRAQVAEAKSVLKALEL
ncbi:hypothetical protein BDV96DRAFT_350869 [Lophiotrema nucula]|uniref:Uncharacterized protein n=1 Tax=Lophiotrema nucula TaxID=690887 RepID=A0A6A5ZJW7_9PLEO|nr:hypothetical protein BDV96DRAFT_350869 [Lophiotrema nucula]